MTTGFTRGWFATFLTIGLGACSLGPPELQIDRELFPHVLSVDTDGDSTALRTTDDSVLHTDAQAHVDEIIENIKRVDAKHIVLIIHGGLKSREDALEDAKEQLGSVLEAPGTYPIFINWETGFASSYADHLFSIRDGEKSWTAKLTFPLYFIADLGRALTRLPITLLDQGVTNLSETFGRPDPLDPPVGWEETMWLDRRNEDSSYLTRAKSLGLAVVPGTMRVVTTPMLDGWGQSAFHNMRRRARVLFLRDEDFDAPETQESGALSLLMEGLRQLYYEDLADPGEEYLQLLQQIHEAEIEALDYAGALTGPELEERIESVCDMTLELRELPDCPLRISVIAHSMGAIVANEIVHRHFDLNYADIVFMGAACTIREFSETTLPYIVASPTTRFYNLTLHPYEEADDRYGYELLPHGSLLDWIDEYITVLDSRLDRTLGKWDNVANAIHVMSYLPTVAQRRIVVRGYARSKDQSNPDFPQDHGDFNNSEFKFWEESSWDFRIDPRTRDQWLRDLSQQNE